MSSATAVETLKHAKPKFRILHVMRAPVGGLFRHVCDLIEAQNACGHSVGLVTDSTTGGDEGAAMLAQLAPFLSLGLLRVPMLRRPSMRDLATALKIGKHADSLGLDVIHGHGAKGGLYARFPRPRAGPTTPIRVYTPHGGSFSITMPFGLQNLYMFIERLLEPFTDAYLFESSFVARRFAEKIGRTRAVTKIVFNGICQAEFRAVTPLPDAADLLYVGELRQQKGIELLIDAVHALKQLHGKNLRLLLVGIGPDKEKFLQQTVSLGLSEQISFVDPMPAQEAFKRGQILVLPSFSESLPYIILEAAAAELPIVATDVGDIGQILALRSRALVPPNDLDALVSALHEMLETPEAARRSEAGRIAAYVLERYALKDMVDAVFGVYQDAMERRSTRTENWRRH